LISAIANAAGSMLTQSETIARKRRRKGGMGAVRSCVRFAEDGDAAPRYDASHLESRKRDRRDRLGKGKLINVGDELLLIAKAGRQDRVEQGG
jgi:hypothetical protein